MKHASLALAALLAAAPLALAPHARAQAPADPFQWLEDVDAPKSMTWVEGQNAKTAKLRKLAVYGKVGGLWRSRARTREDTATSAS